MIAANVERAIAAVGAYSVAPLSMYFGYSLLAQGSTGQFRFQASAFGGTVGLESVAPGLGFAALGMVIAVATTWRLIRREKRGSPE